MSDYHKGKSPELQKRRDVPISNEGTPGRSGTQPDSRPTGNVATTVDTDPAARSGKKGARPTTSEGSQASLVWRADQEPR